MTMRIYQHRVNTVESLAAVPEDRGVEFDLRSDGDRVIVTHDPFTDGPSIEEFFPRLDGRACIFNAKCEGIEARVLDVARRHGIDDFFFLDLSVPAAVALARKGEHRIAVRYSEYEPVEAVQLWRGLAQWVWVDCFTRYPADDEDWEQVTESFRVCLVSPELHGHGGETAAQVRAGLAGRRYHAVCTKRPELWT